MQTFNTWDGTLEEEELNYEETIQTRRILFIEVMQNCKVIFITFHSLYIVL